MIKKYLGAVLIMLSMLFVGITQASADVFTRICVRTGDWANAGTDTSGDIYAVVTGAGGDVIRVEMDNSGVDDLNRNTWSCFDRSSASGFDRVPDVGLAVMFEIDTKGVGDDWCMIQAYTQRWQGRPGQGTLLSEAQFWRPDQGDKSVCFGDESGSVQRHVMRRKNPIPRGTKITTKGQWLRADSHIGNSYTFSHTASVTKGSSSTNTSAWSLAVERGLEIETGFATNSLTVTATTSEEKSITNFNENNLTSTVSKECSAQGLGGGNQELVYWVWSVDIPQRIGSGTRLVTRDSACMIDPPGANLRPACRPGCIDASDLTLQTCKNTSECQVRLR